MMKALLLSILFSVLVSFGDFGNLDTTKEAIMRLNTKVLNKTELLYMHERLHEQEMEDAASLKLSPLRQTVLDNIEKELSPVESVQFNPMGDDIVTVNENAGIGGLLYQSDIVLTEWQVDEIVNSRKRNRKKRQAFKDKNYPRTLWPNGYVHFSFGSNTSKKLQDIFRHGALEWQRITCLNFYEYIHAKERIELIVENGCWSYVGNIHRVQPISLGSGCETIGSAAHEIGHALGMFHHQARHDRDEHLLIERNNIRPGMEDQFNKETTATNDNYGFPYEYGSVMHYGSKSFSADKTRLHTMVPIPDRRYIDTMGSHFVSFYDKLMMNTHYNCLDKCKSNPSAAKCAMGGFPNPKDCSKCVCPGGYGGRLCNERPAGCGEVLQAGTEYKKFEDTIGQNWIQKSTDNDFFLMCHYWIEAPLGRKVEIKFHSFTDKVNTDGCYFAGVEIKTQKDQRATGYRFCHPSYMGELFESDRNVVPIITYSRIWPVTTTLWYRMI
ncbi:unnamed protein product [Cylicocyclus nassatus]|uniref:Zinc metalloproteinase n=1 Tax=Cylicocyclus nassatus TaxID=53992 RepID=A0AA36DQM4_CYLNA|nr:unnamed protein product [Cylicocyclus nassatus]